MKITVLTENTSKCGLPCEHGLSLYIETASKNILFDSGQSGLFAENAERLGIDLRKVDLAVLSHGHYDHGGGLMRFLKLNDTAKIYMNRNAFEMLYNAEDRYIGLDKSLMDSDRIIFADGVTKLDCGMTLYAANELPVILDLGAFGLTMEENGVRKPDDFRHEHYLLIEEDGKRILFSGCSHKGIVNIVDHFRPDVLIGGFHFMKLPLDDKLVEYAKRLDSYDTEYYTCHCTGAEQYAFMKPHMQRLNYLSTGDRISIASRMPLSGTGGQ